MGRDVESSLETWEQDDQLSVNENGTSYTLDEPSSNINFEPSALDNPIIANGISSLVSNEFYANDALLEPWEAAEAVVDPAVCALKAVVQEDEWHYIRLVPLTDQPVQLLVSVYLEGERVYLLLRFAFT